MGKQASLSDADYIDILADDELYYQCCLQIRTKDQGLQPLLLNSSQRFAHERIERQLDETGRVRVLILKGRQQGISTYVGGRFYKKTSTNKGVLAYIVTHEDAATQNLFGMTRRYHENNLPDFKPETGIANANELKFSRLDSGYKIATAGAKTAGRSSTIQFAHLSEFDFWPESSADEVFRGLMEAVPNAPGTEVIIESTADKPGGRFHRAWMAAKNGDSSFLALFIPWFVHDEYREEPPSDWSMPEDFEVYKNLHDLDDAQVYWAWCKNRDMALTLGLGSDEFCINFKREYPATDDEAFEQAGDELRRAIPMSWIRAAQARWNKNRRAQPGPMTSVGLDIAQGGGDSTVAAPLHTLRFEPLTVLKGADTKDGPAVAGAVVSVLRDDAIIALDLGGGWGGDTLTHLKTHMRLPAIGINPGAGATGTSADGKYKFRNMRAQLYWRFREALNPINGEDVELPPDEELAMDLAAPTFEITPSGIQIEKKEDVRKVLGRSPDRGDAVLLAWAGGERATRIRARSDSERARGSRRPSSRAVQRNGYDDVIGRR